MTKQSEWGRRKRGPGCCDDSSAGLPKIRGWRSRTGRFITVPPQSIIERYCSFRYWALMVEHFCYWHKTISMFVNTSGSCSQGAGYNEQTVQRDAWGQTSWNLKKRRTKFCSKYEDTKEKWRFKVLSNKWSGGVLQPFTVKLSNRTPVSGESFALSRCSRRERFSSASDVNSQVFPFSSWHDVPSLILLQDRTAGPVVPVSRPCFGIRNFPWFLPTTLF